MALALAQCSGSCISWHRSMIRFNEVGGIWALLVLLHLITALIPPACLISQPIFVLEWREDDQQVLAACKSRKAHMHVSDHL